MMTFRHVAVSLLALVMSTQVVSAFTEGDYNYSINSDGESVTLVSCYKGISGAVNIPSHAYKKDYTSLILATCSSASTAWTQHNPTAHMLYGNVWPTALTCYTSTIWNNYELRR